MSFPPPARSARGLVRAKRNELKATQYTPPERCVESKKAEAIIAAVYIRLPGLVQNELSGIAAIRKLCNLIVALRAGESPGGPLQMFTVQ